jgi:hypothetical protein
MSPLDILEEPPAARETSHPRAHRPKHDARRRERLKISLPVHVRPFDARYAEIEEVAQVIDFTRDGLFFRTRMPHYCAGMRLIVTFPYGDKVSAHRRMLTTIVRIERFNDGTRGVAVRVLL